MHAKTCSPFKIIAGRIYKQHMHVKLLLATTNCVEQTFSAQILISKLAETMDEEQARINDMKPARREMTETASSREK